MLLSKLTASLTVAAAVARATHAVPMATPLPPAAGLAARVGGAFGGGVAVAALAALQVAHALIQLRGGGNTRSMRRVRTPLWHTRNDNGHDVTHTHRQVQARLPRAPVQRQRVPLPQDHRPDGVQTDARLPAAGARQQQHERETHHQHQLTRHDDKTWGTTYLISVTL